jgi:hypothetical protein
LETPKDITTVKTRTSSKWLGHDNILRIRFYKITNLDVADAMTDAGVMAEIANGNTYPIIIDIRELRFIGAKTNQYLYDRKNYSCINKAAFLVNVSFFNKLMNKVPQKFEIPGVESMCFSNETEALEWINS